MSGVSGIWANGTDGTKATDGTPCSYRSPMSHWSHCSHWLPAAIWFCLTLPASAQIPSLQPLAATALPRVVKIYGAGNSGGLEAYQSGVLVSPDGHVATAWSYVLDADPVVVLADGRRFESTVVGFEPTLELAVLKIDAGDLPFFELPKSDDGPSADWGMPVLAISNLFGIATGSEPASVMTGHIAARMELGRDSPLQTPYRGPILLLDLVANNPGAAGGAVVDSSGRLVGMLGKELRDTATGAYINYALPAEQLRGRIADILAGRVRLLPADQDPALPRDRSHDFDTLGLVLVPDVLETTPAYVDAIDNATPAGTAGLRVNDLILMVDDRRVPHQRALREALRRTDRRDDVVLLIQRGTEILSKTLRP